MPHPSPLAAWEPICSPIFKFPAEMEMAEKKQLRHSAGQGPRNWSKV